MSSIQGGTGQQTAVQVIRTVPLLTGLETPQAVCASQQRRQQQQQQLQHHLQTLQTTEERQQQRVFGPSSATGVPQLGLSSRLQWTTTESAQRRGDRQKGGFGAGAPTLLTG